MRFIGEIIGGSIGAVISGGIAIYISQMSLKAERNQRDNEKLQDRKQLWLRKHYIDIQKAIQVATKNIPIYNNMIYNGAVKITMGSAPGQGGHDMTILNNLYPLTNGNINEHLKSYEFYESFIDSYKKVNAYRTKLQNLYSEFLKISQTIVDKYFDGSVSPRADPLPFVEGYDVDQMFYALVYSVFTKSDYKILTDSNKNFVVVYNKGGSYYAIFISKSEINAETFEKYVMPNITSYFHDKLMSLGSDSTTISTDLATLIPKLSKIVGDYNAGFPVKGECEDCKSIKSVKKLDELMPPD